LHFFFFFAREKQNKKIPLPANERRRLANKRADGQVTRSLPWISLGRREDVYYIV